jgi:hypothetical protein
VSTLAFLITPVNINIRLNNYDTFVMSSANKAVTNFTVTDQFISFKFIFFD